MNTKNHRLRITHALPAVLLAVWYMFSIIGFDFHRDNEHGKLYVVSGIITLECESIHPFLHCHDSESEGECLTDESCCSDDFRAVTSPCECSEVQHIIPVPAFLCLTPVFQVAVPAYQRASAGFGANSPPPEPSAYLSKLCVLRV